MNEAIKLKISEDLWFSIEDFNDWCQPYKEVKPRQMLFTDLVVGEGRWLVVAYNEITLGDFVCMENMRNLQCYKVNLWRTPEIQQLHL